MVYAVSVKNLHFSYDTFSLQNVSLNLDIGEIKALVGLNGSGKTTLFKLILGLLKPVSGKIKVLGTLVNRATLWQIRQKIGFLFQNPADQLFAPTVWEDVAFGPRNQGLSESEVLERVRWALDIVEMTEYINHPVNQLSYGQAKRVALAGIIAMRPKILILDEPFTGLDFPMIHSIIDVVDELRKSGVSVLFTTHNRFFLENWADSIAVMHEGTIIYDGTIETALTTSALSIALGDWKKLKEKMHANRCFSKQFRYG